MDQHDNLALDNLAPDDVAPDEMRHGLPWSKTELEVMTRNFIAAMAAAIRAGKERPPRVGIDQTPGTRNPRYVRAAVRQVHPMTQDFF
jgi:hypothetical protein